MKQKLNVINNHKDQERKSIVIVEDDDGLRFLIQKRLQQNGFETISIADEKELFNHLQIISTASLLLLDYKLPNTTAAAILENLQQQNIAVPFIIITGHGDEKKAVEMMKLGALDYLVKDEHFFDLLTPVILQTFKQIENKRKLIEHLQVNKEKDTFKILQKLQKHNNKILNASVQYFQNNKNHQQEIPLFFKSVKEHENEINNFSLSKLVEYAINFYKILFPENKITFCYNRNDHTTSISKADILLQVLMQLFDYCGNYNIKLEIAVGTTIEGDKKTITININNTILPGLIINTIDDLCCFNDNANEEQCCSIFICKTFITQGLNGTFSINQDDGITQFNISF